ncbi:Uncharacterised protein [Haemophilus influenzae]|nr:hypothetical protein BV165_00293 [Haemophilus influenzae]CWW77424.1 Uncharacterised protein [Haemophilus influenzae]
MVKSAVISSHTTVTINLKSLRNIVELRLDL